MEGLEAADRATAACAHDASALAQPIRDERTGRAVGVTTATLDVSEWSEVATRLRLATEAAGIGIHDYDVARGTIRWDARVRELWGATADEPVTYETLLGGLHPDDVARVDAAVQASLAPEGERRLSIEYRVVHRQTGKVRWVHATGQPTVVDGRAVRLIGTVQDITERRQLAEEVAAAQARLKLALDASDTVLWSWDLASDQLRWSPETHRSVGWPTGLLHPTGSAFDATIHPDDRAFVERELAAAIDERRPFECEYRVVRPDGELVWLADRGQAIYDRSGRPVRMSGTVTNVTKRRLEEEEFRRGEERLRLALEAARAGAWDWDLRTNLVLWSPEMFDLFGMPKRNSPLPYADFAASVDPRDLEQVERAIQAALEGHTAHFRTEFRVMHPGGGHRWLAALGRVQRQRDGTPQRMYGLNLDVTAYKQMEEALQRADRQKDEFLATLSHELRNPLAPIRTAAKILESPRVNDAQIAWSRQVIQRQVNHLALLLDDLLDVARITQGKLELKRSRVELRALLEPAIESVQPLLEQKRHRLVLDVPDEPVVLHVDPLRISQVITNLLTNAAKYTDAGGRIELRASIDGERLVVEVADNGVGIPAQSLPGIFGLFSQLDETRALSGGGLGVGLALVRGLLHLHDGTIEARSDGPGRGSTFRIALPRQRALPDAVPGPVVTPSPVKQRILVVDDNRDAADALGMLLELSGHDVRVLHGGAEAAAHAEQFRAGVAIVDIGMPGIDGYQVARSLRASSWGRQVLLIALTGWGQASDKARAVEAGFDEHLTKPVDPNRLQDVLRRHAPKLAPATA